MFFIGLLQPLGAIMPLAEAQGAWVGDYLLGDYVPPARGEMRADIAADQAAMHERYVASKRHTIQVDFDDYLYALAKRAPGRRRAGARERLSPPGAMPTFCRHNRFLERCPICSKTLPGSAGASAPRAPGARALRATQARGASGASGTARGRACACGARRARSRRRLPLRARAGPASLRRRAPAGRGDRLLVRRLALLAAEPPGLYGDARALGAGGHRAGQLGVPPDRLPLSRSQGDDPFAGIGAALAESWPAGGPEAIARGPGPALPDLEGIPLGPRSSHDPAPGRQDVRGLLQWVERGGSAQRPDPGPSRDAGGGRWRLLWSAERRFARVFERLALPGFARRAAMSCS